MLKKLSLLIILLIITGCSTKTNGKSNHSEITLNTSQIETIIEASKGWAKDNEVYLPTNKEDVLCFEAQQLINECYIKLKDLNIEGYTEIKGSITITFDNELKYTYQKNKCK